jgi:hypothetical protein
VEVGTAVPELAGRLGDWAATQRRAS